MAIQSKFGRTCAAFFIRRWQEFSLPGLIIGTLCFAASLTPSLLPRHYIVQGALSGVTFAVGYGLGRFLLAAWIFLQLPVPRNRWWRVGQWTLSVIAIGLACVALSQTAEWQNSIRILMHMPPETSAYPMSVMLIAIVTASVLILISRAVEWVWQMFYRWIKPFTSPRISFVTSTIVVAILLLMAANNLIAKFALRAADRVFLRLDSIMDDDETPPEGPFATGSTDSLIEWETIGRRGREFLAGGPGSEAISEFIGRPAMQPIRVYAGFRSDKDVDGRAKLAFDELKRVGGFERSILIVAIPTGTGWLDQNAVDTVEYLHGGDTAMVAMGYSYLPSWVTILVDPHRSRETARALFAEVYGYWKTLPPDKRPKLYLYGLSLGALGAEACTDLYTLISDPIQGGVFSGPPFPSPTWKQITRDRNPGSPSWMPRFHDGSVVRFTGRRNMLGDAGNHWGPIRFVYIQHPSDPMVFFSPSLLYREPDWLRGQRGPDVSPLLQWYPVVTGLQVGFDLSMATMVPLGYGHNYDASSYIDAWIAVTDPPNWSPEDILRLKERFADRHTSPLPMSP